MKGIILAGGLGTRLDPMTRAMSKQLLPVYDKPMIYYPLTTLMAAGVREVLLISTPYDLPGFQALLGDGHDLGMDIRYAEQAQPRGIAEALIIGKDFLGKQGGALILGDNLFFWDGLAAALRHALGQRGATLFGVTVADPRRYGVIGFDAHGAPNSLIEKPANPASQVVATGLYVFDGQAAPTAAQLKPSARGELEIMDLARAYLQAGKLHVTQLPRGAAWFDAGTPDSLLDAAEYVRAVECRSGVKLGCPEEAALAQGWLSPQALRQQIVSRTSDYARYLGGLVEGA